MQWRVSAAACARAEGERNGARCWCGGVRRYSAMQLFRDLVCYCHNGIDETALQADHGAFMALGERVECIQDIVNAAGK